MADLKWSGYDRLIARLGAIAEPDAEPLMIEFEAIIVADNRAGVLAGTDKDGGPMRAVTYRPIKTGARPTTDQQVNNDRRGVFSGFGPAAAGLHNNLTSAEYRRLDGPPTAPRRENSRVITNLRSGHSDGPSDGVWIASAWWQEVVSTTGYEFLPDLFAIRDLRGVRPDGRAKALTAAKRWLSNVVKGKA